MKLWGKKKKKRFITNRTEMKYKNNDYFPAMTPTILISPDEQAFFILFFCRQFYPII